MIFTLYQCVKSQNILKAYLKIDFNFSVCEKNGNSRKMYYIFTIVTVMKAHLYFNLCDTV